MMEQVAALQPSFLEMLDEQEQVETVMYYTGMTEAEARGSLGLKGKES